MNLLPSPSCSSSSSFSTSTFDAHVCNPRAAAATPCCLSGILRRILCSGSLPTHPSDHTTEETNSVKSDDKLVQVKDVSVMNARNEGKGSAGIVGRLMGLDAMPEMKQNHNTAARSHSQSMNSMEHFYKHLEGKHKGVRPTVSFREMPTFIELENEKYFILSFEETRSEQRKEEKVKCKNRGTNKTEIFLKDLKQKKKPRKVESIGPVSVLDTDSTPLSTNPNSDSSIGFLKNLPIYNGVRPERFEEGLCKITEMELLSEPNWIKCTKIREELGVGDLIEGFDSYVIDKLIAEFVEQMYDSIFFSRSTTAFIFSNYSY